MNNASSKKIVFLITCLLVVFVSVISITFALFIYSRTSDANEQVVAGTIRMKFSEESNGISLVDALPISDTTALNTKNENDYFDFAVYYSISNNAKIDYNVYLENTTLSLDEVSSGSYQAFDSTEIKVALKNKDNDSLVYSPNYFSELGDTTSNGNLIYNKTVSGEGTDNYRLYMWIPEYDSSNKVINIEDIVGHTFSLIVNVEGSASVN